MQLYIKHGRDLPDQQLDDWGEEGPLLKNVSGIHVTYLTTYNVWFLTQEDADAARLLTGWQPWDSCALSMPFHEDLLVTEVDGVKKYYGDWGLI